MKDFNNSNMIEDKTYVVVLGGGVEAGKSTC